MLERIDEKKYSLALFRVNSLVVDNVVFNPCY